MGYERLTNRSPKNGMAYLVNVKPDEQEVDSPYKDTLKCIMDSFNRLAAYEDSGLSPEEVLEFARADAEGRLRVLPCKPGDTIYRLDGLQYSWQIVSITIYPDEIIFTDDSDNIFGLDNIGKTIFFTREAAEKALGGGGDA
jgi:hypothetical protein